MKTSESIKELATALAAAQAEIENASKNSKNDHFKNRYADLAEVLNTVRPVLARHKLSVAQFPSLADGMVSVETILMHASGEWISGIASAPLSKPDAQGVGSATTYLRRYSLAALAGVAQEDDDGNGAMRQPARQQDDGGLAAFEAQHLQAMREAAMDGSKALAVAFSNLPKGPHTKAFWAAHQASLKSAAAAADAESGA
jgi:hypothetical protein